MISPLKYSQIHNFLHLPSFSVEKYSENLKQIVATIFTQQNLNCLLDKRLTLINFHVVKELGLILVVN